MQHSKGITLIALVITIIVLIILAAISIAALTGENGLIQNAQRAAFMEEIQAVKENVVMKQMKILAFEQEGETEELFTEKFNVNESEVKDTLKREILYIRDGMPEDKSPNDYDVEEFENLVQGDGTIEGIYIIDEETGNGKKDTYIYDEKTDTVYKISQTKIGSNIYHSYETITKGKGGTSTGSGTIDKESEVVHVGDEYYYAPNLKGFSSKDTSVVYYSSDLSKTKEVPAQEYIDGGEQYQIEGGTYTFHNYGKQSKIWANVKTTANGKEAWWVWIPRYAYKIDNSGASNLKMNIIYVGTNNEPLDPQYGGTLPEGYETHPAFNQGGKKLKGIWMSKYEADYKYLETSQNNNVIQPDMTGFDEEHTCIEIYDENMQNIKEEIKLSEADLTKVNEGNKWYNYTNKKWANIKTDANGKEAWWVWIPRYAYKITTDSPKGTISEIIFVDENDKPIDSKYGDRIPTGYEIHPAFNQGGKKLKGIWMSKYEADYKYLETSQNNNVIQPDMIGFDEEHTYIEIYDENMQNIKEEIKLSEADLTKVNEGNKWHDYANKKWANIKTDANGKEAWWVWIPRYAYKITTDSPKGTISEIIFVDENDKTIDSKYGDKIPTGYEIHPAFNQGGKKLKGIWMSKYEARNIGN